MSPDSRRIHVVLGQACAAALVVLAAIPATAQSPEPAAAALGDAIVAANLTDGGASVPTAQLPPTPVTPVIQMSPALTAPPPERPALLLPLYGSFGVLQALDAHSTLEAVRGGAIERNPILKPIGDSPGAMFAVKAATTAGTIFLAEKLWRRHPTRAVVVMLAINVAYGAIVAANYRR